MQGEAEKMTPLAARVVLGKKEAATSAISVVILVNMIVLVLVRATGLIIPSGLSAVFWVIVAILLAADVSVSPLCFYYALKEVKENNAAPDYTIAMKENGMIVLFHSDRRPQELYSGDVVKVTSRVARFNWNALSGGSGRGYGTVKFVVQSQMGRIVKYKVKYVVNCDCVAEFLCNMIGIAR
ncbi:MAG: hypothetical protein LUI60_07830 [Clostridia bacterium]|nr:hypothetical protein [Clostridia bacterium]